MSDELLDRVSRSLNNENRYLRDLDRDDKSGYRLACRPVAMVETLIMDQVKACGSVTLAVILAHGVRVGVPEREVSRAVLHLVVGKRLSFDVATGVVSKPVPPLPWYKRIFQIDRIHPANLGIACFGITTALCVYCTR